MKKAWLLAPVLLAGVILAGCTASPSQNDARLELDSSTTTTTTKTTDSTKQLQASPAPQKGSMKTLNDFEKIEATTITFKTSKGDIVAELYREATPVTTANFLQLAKDGFYDGQVFHRVIEDFMAQVGDPQSKDPAKKAVWGTGGPGYTIPDELKAELKHDSEGILSMANTGMPNSGGSQIFITFGPTPWLDGKHTVFGKVTQGLEVLRKIEQGDTLTSVTYQ